MINIYAVRKGKFIKDMTFDEIKKRTKPLLIDCFNPTKKEISEISKKFSISTSDLTLALDNESRPRIMDYDDYSMIIFTSVIYSRSKIQTLSFGMFLCNDKLLIIRKDKLPFIDKFKALTDEQKVMEISKGCGYLIYLLMDKAFDNYFRIMDQIDEEIEMIESKVFKSPDENMVKKVFGIKKDLIYVHKALTAEREVIGGIEKGYLQSLSKKDIQKFRFVYNDVTELIDIESTYRDILTGTLEIYMSSVSNKLNEIMKKMTAMASFILIPTLISGIYGMNFKFMPEFGWKYGYGFVLMLMVISVVIMYVYFKDMKWL